MKITSSIFKDALNHFDYDFQIENRCKIFSPSYYKSIKQLSLSNNMFSIEDSKFIEIISDKRYFCTKIFHNQNAYTRFVQISSVNSQGVELLNINVVCYIGEVSHNVYIPIFIVYETAIDNKCTHFDFDITISQKSNKLLMRDEENELSSLWIFPDVGSKYITYDLFNIFAGLGQTNSQELKNLLYEKLILPYIDSVGYNDNNNLKLYYAPKNYQIYSYMKNDENNDDTYNYSNNKDNNKKSLKINKNIHNGGKIMKNLGSMGEILKMSLMTKMMSQPDGEFDFGKLMLLQMFDGGEDGSGNGEQFKFSNVVKSKLITQIMNGKEKIDDLPIDKLLSVQMLEDGDLDMEKLMMMKFVPSLIKSIVGDEEKKSDKKTNEEKK